MGEIEVTEKQQERDVKRVAQLVGDLYLVDAWFRRGTRLALSLRHRFMRQKSMKLLSERLEMAGYTFTLTPGEETVLLEIDPKPRIRIPLLNIGLFLVTVVTVYVVPSLSFGWDMSAGGGIEFTVALMSILLVHEMGHYVAGRRRDIVTSWPYFIPAPNIIGTFGAIIRSKSPFWNRRDLLEVGAAGPVAGWFVAVGWLMYGLSKSVPIPDPHFSEGAIVFGHSLITSFLSDLIQGPAPEGYIFSFPEAAFAGWVGLLVTAINMLPIGQLDGGHVLYGLFRRFQRPLAFLALAGLIALGFQSHMWWFFAGLGIVFGVSHPPTINDSKPPSRAARVLGWTSLVILILSFTPVPIRFL
ncbi:site-2 protease family protein [candidate division GN15 bacterium]|nr:site-2 protease family protein [candidate division GN15 bacterium]